MGACGLSFFWFFVCVRMNACIYVCNSTFSPTKPDIFYSDLQSKLATRSLLNMAFLSTTSRLMSSRVLDQLVVSLTGTSKLPNYHSLDFAAFAGSRICTRSGGRCYNVPVGNPGNRECHRPRLDGGENYDTPALPWPQKKRLAAPTSFVSNSVVILLGRGSGLESNID